MWGDGSVVLMVSNRPNFFFFYLLGGFWAGQNSEVSAGAVILIDF